jgi:hypothetical protein
MENILSSATPHHKKYKNSLIAKGFNQIRKLTRDFSLGLAFGRLPR